MNLEVKVYILKVYMRKLVNRDAAYLKVSYDGATRRMVANANAERKLFHL